MAAHEEKEAISGLLRRSLATEHGAGACPEPDMLAAYFERSLDADEMATYETHLSRCARCRKLLAQMVRAEPRSEPQHKRLWLLDWRLLSAVTAAMVLLTVWAMRRPDQNLRLGARPTTSAIATAKPQGASPEAKLEAKAEEHGLPQERVRTAETSPAATLPGKADAVTAKDRELDKTQGVREPARDQISQYAQSRNQNQSQNQNQNQKRTEGLAGGFVREAAAGHGSGSGVGANQQQQLQEPSVTGGTLQGNAQTNQAPTVPQTALMSAAAPAAPASEALSVQTAPPMAGPAAAKGLQAGNGGATTQATQDTKASTEKSKKMSVPAASEFVEDRSSTMQTLEDRSAEKIISTPNPAVRWRITNNGFVERSEDGGLTWHGQQPYPDIHLTGGSAPNAKTCWLVGRDGVVLVTKDGISWKKVPSPTSADLVTVTAKNASSATVTTADGQRFVTHNNGKKWKPEN